LARAHFLLEKDNTYHLLGYKDYQALEWLNSDLVHDAGKDETVFRKTVLSKLEESYKVNRHNLLESNNISSRPESQVMVNELNDTFLMLTPQWLYEGFLLEGSFKENSEILRNGESYSIQRDRVAEEELLNLLKSLHPAFEKQSGGYFYVSFEDARKKNWFLNAYHKLLEAGIRITGMDLLRHFRFSEHKAATDMEIRNGSHEHELCLLVRITFGDEIIPLLTIQRILLSSQHTVLLADDSLGVLDEAWQHQYGDIFRHGRIKDNEIRIEKWMAVTEQHESEGSQPLKSALADDWWSLWDHWQGNKDFVFEIPGTIQVAQLRPYQQKGFEWLSLLAQIGVGACLADDMGLGKTLQTICFLARRLEHFPGMKHLVVCPASVVYNWQQELEKFAPGLRINVFHGNGRNASDLQREDIDIIITSMGTLRSDIDLIENIPFCVAVVDESHNIKNPYALITRAVNRIQAVTRVALSGTPVMNNTFDLYAQLNFVAPGMFGSREFFKRMYGDPIDRDHDPAKIKLLQKLTAPFILRRTKEQVAPDLPEKTELVLWCDMGMQQRDQYEDVLGQIRSSIFLEIERDGFERSKLSIIQGITKLRQVCNSPVLLPNADFFCEDSVKTEILMDELLNNLKGHKVLVFSQFSKMLDLLAKQLEDLQLDFFHFDGQTPPKQRMEMVNSFQEEGNKTDVFLISLMAGNTGLNLTAADYVILFDPWWNTAVQQQAIDRTHRIGQTKKVFAYKMICRDTIEEKILYLQERKKLLSDTLIGGEDGFVKNLTMKDLEYLLK
jgi:superfamily II DNA or RNA helicase